MLRTAGNREGGHFKGHIITDPALHAGAAIKGDPAVPETGELCHEARRHIGLRFITIARRLRNSFDRQVVSLNVSLSQWAMIAAVSRAQGTTQRIIAETLEMSEASAGRLVDRLCEDGLLDRRSHQSDRRARAVHLTPAAESLLETLGAIARASDQRMFKGFSEDELTQLAGMVDRIHDNVSR